MSSHRHFHRLAWLAAAFALCVIVFGAFVRLSNAGLSCPDWPTCYGHATWPTQTQDVAQANQAFPGRPVEADKDWREQVHRMLAGTLGALVFILAIVATRRRPRGIAVVIAASLLVAISIPFYIRGSHAISGAIAAVGEALLVAAAIAWSSARLPAGAPPDSARLAALTLAVVVFQALLGQWTVTWLVMPIVVMGHLLGGLATFALLTAMAWRATPGARLTLAGAPRLRRLLWVGFGLLVVQIALGGWTSSNYAAWACGAQFPKCLDQWWPDSDFRQAFVLWRGFGVDYSGGVLDNTARVAIQMSHRIMAFLVFGHLTAVGVRLIRTPGLRSWGVALLALMVAQIGLGISNVVFALPLPIAVAHNAGAALLLFVVVSLLARLREPSEVAVDAATESA
ncbi:MAG TPA: COX15/CtaA family protein [Xanthomonadaceae bacterium]|jgi:cytochrome c oxidase assembly protein subunit 15|nr:COX15/CtaA family protein [Xanthomonadaceae bacterium]